MVLPVTVKKVSVWFEAEVAAPRDRAIAGRSGVSLTGLDEDLHLVVGVRSDVIDFAC